MKKSTHVFTIIASLAAILALWTGAAALVGSELVLPDPRMVAEKLVALGQTVAFWQHIGATVIRSISAFIFSALLSLLLGSASGLNPTISLFLRFPLSIIKSTPVVSFILIALFWFTSSTVPVFVSILMTLPVMTESIASGITQTDDKLLAMAKIYGFSKKQIVHHVYIPSISPYFTSAAVGAFGLSWKVVVAGEVLSLPKFAAGSALQTAKVHLETSEVFSYTITVILISYILESIFAAIVKTRRPNRV
jgi:NitT/TauT family transport system permease protein